jgi:addiction module RelE/StbE family toxin
MYIIVFSKHFERELKKIIKKEPKLKNKIEKQFLLLHSNPKQKSLRLHKLQGRDNWSLSITMGIRLIFSIRGNKIICLKIGPHDEVYN